MTVTHSCTYIMIPVWYSMHFISYCMHITYVLCIYALIIHVHVLCTLHSRTLCLWSMNNKICSPQAACTGMIWYVCIHTLTVTSLYVPVCSSLFGCQVSRTDMFLISQRLHYSGTYIPAYIIIICTYIVCISYANSTLYVHTFVSQTVWYDCQKN